MPWTFAHPAAVLPLRRLFPGPERLMALVAGALVPDLAYYVAAVADIWGHVDVRPWGTWAHSLLGWVLVDAPLAAGLAALCLRGWGWMVAPLPQPWRGGLLALGASASAQPVSSVAGRAAGLLLAGAAGAATHLLWDGFTHAPGFFVRHLAWLRVEVAVLEGRSWQVFNLLQHASTLVGVGVLGLALMRWRQREASRWPASPADRPRRVSLIAALSISAVLGGMLGGMFGGTFGAGQALPGADAAGQTHVWVVRGVIRATGLMALAYAGLAVWWRPR